MRRMLQVIMLGGASLWLGVTSTGCCCVCPPPCRTTPYYCTPPSSSCYQASPCATAGNDRLVPTPMPNTVTR